MCGHQPKSLSEVEGIKPQSSWRRADIETTTPTCFDIGERERGKSHGSDCGRKDQNKRGKSFFFLQQKERGSGPLRDHHIKSSQFFLAHNKAINHKI